MDIIYKRHSEGKTTELIRRSAKNWFYIICRDRTRAHNLQKRARGEFHLDIPFPITFNEFLNGDYYGKGCKGFLLDDADQFIQSIARDVTVVAISMTDRNPYIVEDKPEQPGPPPLADKPGHIKSDDKGGK